LGRRFVKKEKVVGEMSEKRFYDNDAFWLDMRVGIRSSHGESFWREDFSVFAFFFFSVWDAPSSMEAATGFGSGVFVGVFVKIRSAGRARCFGVACCSDVRLCYDVVAWGEPATSVTISYS